VTNLAIREPLRQIADQEGAAKADPDTERAESLP
jgi:hypothetical protein